MFILVGIPTVLSNKDLLSRQGGSPIHFTHNYAYLSQPYTQRIEEIPSQLRAIYRFSQSKHFFNTSTGRSEFLFSLEDVSTPVRSSLGFRPYVKFLDDPLRSASSKKFCLAFANSLHGTEIELSLLQLTKGDVFPLDDGQEISIYDQFNHDATFDW